MAESRHPPTKTESRRKSCCSSASKSWWLQAMVLRKVCCRAGTSRAPLVKTVKRGVSRARSACGGSSLTRAAANSIAKGNPSRCRQISATTLAFALLSWNSGLAARARWMKRASASYCASSTTSGRCLGSGRESGGTANSCSACTCSTMRLVTSTLSCRQAASSSATWRAAPTTCSKLSSSSKSRFSPKKAFSRSSTGWPASSLRSSASAMVGRANAGSRRGARFTKYTPSGNASLSSAATCSARRVLPMPPGPVRVSKRTSSRRSRRPTAATSCSRPMNAVGWTGKLFGWLSRVKRGGNSAGRPAMTS